MQRSNDLRYTKEEVHEEEDEYLYDKRNIMIISKDNMNDQQEVTTTTTINDIGTVVVVPLHNNQQQSSIRVVHDNDIASDTCIHIENDSLLFKSQFFRISNESSKMLKVQILFKTFYKVQIYTEKSKSLFSKLTLIL